MSEHIITNKQLDRFGIPAELFTEQEIVRCRDCKRFQPNESSMLSCKFEYKEFIQWRSAEPDGFCAWGERRDA